MPLSLRNKSLKFLIDSSVMTAGRLRKLLEACAVNSHHVFVPALVHAECVFKLRRRHGSSYKPDLIDTWYVNFPDTLKLAPLDRVSADALAESLFKQFPDEEKWKCAKREMWRHALGLPEGLTPSSRRTVAPVDAYLVGLASPASPIVSEDGGIEWTGWPAGSVIKFELALTLARVP